MTITISNHKLLNEVYRLENEKTISRELTIKNMVQIAILRGAFGVKDIETEDKSFMNFKDYERYQVNTNKDIIDNFNDKIDFYHDLPHSRLDNMVRIKYLIEAVKFFNEELANELKQISRNRHVQLY